MMAPDGGASGGGGEGTSQSSSTTLLPQTATQEHTEPDRGSTPSFSSSSSMTKAAMVTIKVEELHDLSGTVVDHDGFNDAGGVNAFTADNDNIKDKDGSPLFSSLVLPKPMEGLLEMGPPPFLRKTFEMVEDAETDQVVSWGKGGESFIVWDSFEFSKNLLPKHFRHSNFSSFIRQLNTYGFRKIDPDRWEFANEGFQEGKKHLLKNIRRKSRYNKLQEQGLMNSSDTKKLGLRTEVEDLKNDQDALRVEIMSLKKQQEDSQNYLAAAEERIQAAECKQLQMFIFFTNVLKNPSFIQQLIQKRRRQEKLDGGEFRKRRRLLQTPPSSLPDAANTCPGVKSRNLAEEQLVTMQTELGKMLKEDTGTCQMSELFPAPISDEFGSTIKNHRTNVISAASADDTCAYNLMSGQLLDDSAALENSDNQELDANDSNFYLELEDLIGKPRAWDGYAAELVEHAGCV